MKILEILRLFRYRLLSYILSGEKKCIYKAKYKKLKQSKFNRIKIEDLSEVEKEIYYILKQIQTDRRG